MVANFLYSQTFTTEKVSQENYHGFDYQVNIVKEQVKVELKICRQVFIFMLLFLALISLFGVLINTLRSIPGRYLIDIVYLFI